MARSSGRRQARQRRGGGFGRFVAGVAVVGFPTLGVLLGPTVAHSLKAPPGIQPAEASYSATSDGYTFALPILSDGREDRGDGVTEGTPVGYAKGEVHFLPGNQAKVQLCVAQTAGDPRRRIGASIEGQPAAISADPLDPARTLGGDSMSEGDRDVPKESCGTITLANPTGSVLASVTVRGSDSSVSKRRGPSSMTFPKPGASPHQAPYVGGAPGAPTSSSTPPR